MDKQDIRNLTYKHVSNFRTGRKAFVNALYKKLEEGQLEDKLVTDLHECYTTNDNFWMYADGKYVHIFINKDETYLNGRVV